MSTTTGTIQPARVAEPALGTSDPRTATSTTTAHKAVGWRKVAFWSSMVAVPIAVARLGSRRSSLIGSVAGGLAALALGGFRWQFQRWFTDEPAYENDRPIGPLEIRRYAPRVEARTSVLTKDHDSALQIGFRRLADYIFGGNARRESIEMTAPVVTRGERLAMTAPVINQRSADSYVMSFVMPPRRDLASLPIPTDDRVELVQVPERRVAVLTYRGRYDAPTVQRRQDELLAAARRANLQVVGEPLFAGFDPPNTFPWLRRNEVWVEIV